MAHNLLATTFSTTGFLLFASLIAAPSRSDAWWLDALKDRLTLVWEKKLQDILTPVMVCEHIFSSAHSGRTRLFEIGVYMHLKNERFVCIDLKSGEDRWTSKTFGKYWSMVGNVGQRKILALSEHGMLFVFFNGVKI